MPIISEWVKEKQLNVIHEQKFDVPVERATGVVRKASCGEAPHGAEVSQDGIHVYTG